MENRKQMNLNTELLDYQAFCELLDMIDKLRELCCIDRKQRPLYQKKIEQICERVDRDFLNDQAAFLCWVTGKPVITGHGDVIVLARSRDVIFTYLILNRRKELTGSVDRTDEAYFKKMCSSRGCQIPTDLF